MAKESETIVIDEANEIAKFRRCMSDALMNKEIGGLIDAIKNKKMKYQIVDMDNTVEQIAEKMVRIADDGFMIDSTNWAEGLSRSDAIEYADRILAAHKCELAAKDAEIARLITSCVSGDCERISLGAEPCADCFRERARQEIDDLKAKNRDMFNAVIVRDKMIKDRDAIIKELAELASDGLCHLDCSGCPQDTKCESKRRREIIAKAREAVK